MFHVNMQPKSRKKFRDNLNTETSVETRSTGGNEHLSKMIEGRREVCRANWAWSDVLVDLELDLLCPPPRCHPVPFRFSQRIRSMHHAPHPQPALAFGHPIPGRPVRGCDCTTHPATQDLLVGARIPGPGDRLRPMIRWRSQGPLKDAQGATAKRLF
jgi:hypothetical protein